MKKLTFLKALLWINLALLASCGGNTGIKPEKNTPNDQAKSTAPATESAGKGGYYLDDGPSDKTPAELDSIPDAQPKTEDLNERANKPYIALEQQYTPMTAYTPYKKQGMASWYGKRYHGKKTSTGEVYDMFGMTAAHTTLPIPSYAKVTNVANGRSVIVRINDRGPFKSGRLIDLSYAAAYKLRMIDEGSAMVEVEAIDNSFEALEKNAVPSRPEAINSHLEPPMDDEIMAMPEPKAKLTVPAKPNKKTTAASPKAKTVSKADDESDAGIYLQVGAFKSEENSKQLMKKMQSYALPEDVHVVSVYNGSIYRVKVGPYASRGDAEEAAMQIKKQLNIPAMIQK